MPILILAALALLYVIAAYWAAAALSYMDPRASDGHVYSWAALWPVAGVIAIVLHVAGWIDAQIRKHAK